MTCIVALKQEGNIYIGGDSAGVSGNNIRTRADQKVFKKSGIVFGFTTSFRMGQLIKYCLAIPKQKKRKPTTLFYVLILLRP